MMHPNTLVLKNLNNVVLRIASAEFERQKENKTRESSSEGSHLVPLKLTVQEAKRAEKYQKTMLKFMKQQYKKSIGTKEEALMHKLYNDALIDYKTFIKQYKKELSL